MRLGRGVKLVVFIGVVSTGKVYTSSALPSPIDCCQTGNCSSSSGGTPTPVAASNLFFKHLNGLQPANLTPLDLPQEWIDLDSMQRWDWSGTQWIQVIV